MRGGDPSLFYTIAWLVTFVDTHNYEHYRQQSLQWSRRANQLSHLHDLYVEMSTVVTRYQKYVGEKIPPHFDPISMRQKALDIAYEMNDLNDAVSELVPLHVEHEFLSNHRDSFSLANTLLTLADIKALPPFALQCFYRLYQYHIRINSHPDILTPTTTTTTTTVDTMIDYFTQLLVPLDTDNLALTLKTKSPLGEPRYQYKDGVARWIYQTDDTILSVQRIVDYRLPTPNNVRYACELPSRTARHMTWDGLVGRLWRWGCLSFA